MKYQDISMVDLPTPPHSLLAVIHYCSEDQAEADKLASLIRIDPLLSAELLRIANSPYFGLGGSVTSLNRATVVLGMKTVRSLALGIALKGLSAETNISGFNDLLFWEDGIRRAAIATILGEHMRLDTDECFTAGLLQDIGLLVLLSQEGASEDFIETYRTYNPDIRKVLEKEEFGEHHDSIASFLATQWHIPATLVDGICHHHDDPVNASPLASLLYCADWLNTFFIRNNDAEVAAYCHGLLMERLKIPAQDAIDIISTLPENIRGIAQAFGHTIDMQDCDIEQLINNAASQLAEHNIELQEVTARLTRTIEERDSLSEKLHRDIAIAQEVQQALLPPPTTDIPIHAFNVPAMALSGDFYDFKKLPDGKLSFCLGDVSGKGVYSSLLMVKASSLFRSLCGRVNDQEELAVKLNAEICRIAVRGMFITMVTGIYDPEKGTVEFVNAGHLPVLLVSENDSIESKTSSSPPFGILPDARFEKEVVTIKGRSFYLYSDGITESPISENRMLGIDGLAALLKKVNSEAPDKRVKRLKSHFRKTRDQLHDDTTLLLLKG